MPFNTPLCKQFLEKKKSVPVLPGLLHGHCETPVGKIIAGPLNVENCSDSLCLSSQDFGLCIPAREVNNVSGCRRLSRTHCRVLLHPGRIGRLFVKCPESALINFKDEAKGQTLTTKSSQFLPSYFWKYLSGDSPFKFSSDFIPRLPVANWSASKEEWLVFSNTLSISWVVQMLRWNLVLFSGISSKLLFKRPSSSSLLLPKLSDTVIPAR